VGSTAPTQGTNRAKVSPRPVASTLSQGRQRGKVWNPYGTHGEPAWNPCL
jgi:hypothetical protein